MIKQLKNVLRFGIISGILFFGSMACAGNKVAEFKGGSITAEELESKVQMQLYQLKQQEYEIKKQTLQKMIEDKVLELEAKAQGKTPEQLIEELHKKQYREVPEADRRRYYEQNKDRIGRSYEDVKDDLASGFEEQQKGRLKQNYVQGLMKKYDVQINLQEPVRPSITVDTDDDPFWGNPNAKVVIVEFSDFECPYCKRMQADIQRIKQEYQDKIKWVFRDFPLPFHRQAMTAHIAANCAGKQNRYWDMQQALFQLNPNLSKSAILAAARNMGLDVAKLESCMQDKNGEERREIEKDRDYGQSIGVRGTPTLFINGEYYSGVRPYATLKQMIENALKR